MSKTFLENSRAEHFYGAGDPWMESTGTYMWCKGTDQIVHRSDPLTPSYHPLLILKFSRICSIKIVLLA